MFLNIKSQAREKKENEKKDFHEGLNVKTWDNGAREGSEADELQKGRRREKEGGKQKWNLEWDGD